jgi:hypothetical protein
LPDIDVTFHSWDPSMEGCSRHGGFWTFTQEGHEIDVCAVGTVGRRRMLLHEFAHSCPREPDGEPTQQVIEERGLESWNDAETDWDQRGGEQAAEIIKWGLYVFCEPQHMIRDEDPESLAAAFRFLTSTDRSVRSSRQRRNWERDARM